VTILHRDRAAPQGNELQDATHGRYIDRRRRAMPSFDSDGVEINYQEHGSGDPVILVHGFASSADNNWGITGWFKALAPQYRVIALDCRGHGQSGKPHERAAYSGDKMRGDIINLMNHLGIARTLLMGYSMGARISLDLLLHNPERLRAVVLGGIGGTPSSGVPFSRQPIIDAFLVDDPNSIVAPTAKQFRQFAELNRNDLKALAACMGADRRDATEADVAKLSANVPVLIVIGTKDLLVGDPQALRASIPGSRLVMLEGRDHLNAPGDRRYREEVIAFFQTVPA
jgi:pimeloyl-ACP methyl ester carboxylesterase